MGWAEGSGQVEIGLGWFLESSSCALDLTYSLRFGLFDHFLYAFFVSLPLLRLKQGRVFRNEVDLLMVYYTVHCLFLSLLIQLKIRMRFLFWFLFRFGFLVLTATFRFCSILKRSNPLLLLEPSLKNLQIIALKAKKLLSLLIFLIASIAIINLYIHLKPSLLLLLLLLLPPTLDIPVRNLLNINLSILKKAKPILPQNRVFLTQPINNIFLARHTVIGQLFDELIIAACFLLECLEYAIADVVVDVLFVYAVGFWGG